MSLDPEDLPGELSALRIGKPVVEWYQAELVRLREMGGPSAAGAPQVDWAKLREEFFTGLGTD